MNLKATFSVWNLSIFYLPHFQSPEIYTRINYSILQMKRRAYVACNFNCLIETEELLKVTSNYIHCKSGNISEMVQDRDVLPQATNRKWCIWPIEYREFGWPWVTVKVINLLRPFTSSSAIAESPRDACSTSNRKPVKKLRLLGGNLSTWAIFEGGGSLRSPISGGRGPHLPTTVGW